MSDHQIVVNARCLTQPMTGTQRYAYNVIRRLPELRLIAPALPAAQFTGISHDRFAVAPHFLSSHLWEQFVLPRYVSKDDVLWSPGGLGSSFVKNLVLTITDLAVFENPYCYGKVFGAWYRMMYPRVVKRARRILTISNFTAGVIRRVLGVPADRVVVTHLGVDPFFSPRPPAALEPMRRRFGISGRYILAVGALSPRKNLSGLLWAWGRVERSVADVQLVVVAEGNFAFSSTSSLGPLPPRCVQLRGIDDETLALLYSGATAFIYPSIYEGFGLPVLEAMACGAPVVTSNVTSLPEVAGDAALQVDPYDLEAIADAIEAVATSGALRDELRVKGFSRAASFSWDDTASRTWKTLHEAAN